MPKLRGEIENESSYLFIFPTRKLPSSSWFAHMSLNKLKPDYQSVSILEECLCKPNSNRQPVVAGDGGALSPRVSTENRAGNHRNLPTVAFSKPAGLQWIEVALRFFFLFLFPTLPSHIFKIKHFTRTRGESQTRALHWRRGPSSDSIMQRRWWFLCELSLEFYIWPSTPLFPGWVMTAAVSLPLSLCLPPPLLPPHPLRVFCS